MVHTVRDSATDTAVETDAIHDLTIDELETVSGGCPLYHLLRLRQTQSQASLTDESSLSEQHN